MENSSLRESFENLHSSCSNDSIFKKLISVILFISEPDIQEDVALGAEEMNDNSSDI